DLIPNLVSTVKGVANFEQTTLTAVVNARSAWASAGTQEQKVDAANQLDSAISRLLVTVEAYPTLTATQAYKDLMVSLEGTENRISFARGEYNTAVQSYNAAIKTFPGNVMAGMFGFSPKKFYESKPGSEDSPVVDFNVE
ncbi:MAG: LemA family protein, partial [bacterium]